MKIVEIIKKRNICRPTLSFEIFPPKPQSNMDIVQIADELAKFAPDFISVTYGAGGSTKDKTIEIASMIKQKYGIETIAHLTCISFTKDQIAETAQKLRGENIENILALRGDIPVDPNFKFPNPLHFEHADDLVHYLSSQFSFCLGGAFYPEGHTETKDLAKDLFYTIKKINSGMEFLISQMFFDNTFFYRSRAKIRELGYKTPLIAGIMPIMSAAQMDRVCKLSGCEFPELLTKIMKNYAHSPDALREAGLEFTANQIVDLINHDVDGIHIYTMNNPSIIKQLLTKISLMMSSTNEIKHKYCDTGILTLNANSDSNAERFDKPRCRIPFLEMNLN